MSDLVRHYLDLLETRSRRISCLGKGRLDSDLASIAAVMTPEEIEDSWRAKNDAWVDRGVRRAGGLRGRNTACLA
jgi:hypothetical protein